MTPGEPHSSRADSFDEGYDVIVVGYGFAGGAAAIEASDAGARVLLLEKMPDAGGISMERWNAPRKRRPRDFPRRTMSTDSPPL